MKILIYLIIAFFLPGEIICQWFWQNPLPQGNRLTEIKFVSPQTGFAVGYYGTLLKTTDGGISWNLQEMGDRYKYHYISIDFPDSLTGIIVGYENRNNQPLILRTTDGGLNWTEIPLNGINSRLTQVFFLDENYGMIVGYELILVSYDKGESWEIRYNDGLDNYWIYSATFADKNLGLSTGEGDSGPQSILVRRTTDGGLTWHGSFSFGIDRGDVKFIDSSTAIISWGYRGYGTHDNKIYRSTDAGLSWVLQQPGYPEWGYSKISFYNDKLGVILAEKPPYLEYGFLLTTDGGVSWVFNHITNKELTGIAFADERTLIAYGTGGLIMRSSDSGVSWSTQSQGSYDHLRSVYFTDKDNGIAVGKKILKTTDRGKSWSEQPSASHYGLYCVSFFDNKLGLTVGVDGYIFKTTDGGTSWEQVETGIIASLRSVAILSEKKWIITGGYTGSSTGIVLLTSDGGLTWNLKEFVVSHPNNSFFYDMAFKDSLTGIIIGYTRSIKTSDGGLTWAPQPVGGFSITFIDDQTGYISGSHKLYKTIDGGDTWLESEFPFNALSIYFTDADNGTAVGGSPSQQILRTTNGGIDWVEQFRGGGEKLYDVFFTDYDNGFVVGDYGTILSTSNGGGIIVNIDPKYEGLIKKSYSLSQNYPNPFNPSTTIKYSLPQTGRVTLNIFDLLGREVVKLIDEEKPAGEYETNWNAASYPSGVYFLRMQAGDFSETRKVVLVK